MSIEFIFIFYFDDSLYCVPEIISLAFGLIFCSVQELYVQGISFTNIDLFNVYLSFLERLLYFIIESSDYEVFVGERRSEYCFTIVKEFMHLHVLCTLLSMVLITTYLYLHVATLQQLIYSVQFLACTIVLIGASFILMILVCRKSKYIFVWDMQKFVKRAPNLWPIETLTGFYPASLFLTGLFPYNIYPLGFYPANLFSARS